MHFWNLFQIWYFKLYKNSRARVQVNPFILSSKALLRTYYVLGADPDTKGNTAVDTQPDIPQSELKPSSPPPPSHRQQKSACNVLPETPSAAGKQKDKTTQMNKGYEDASLQRRYANGQQVAWPPRRHYIPGYYGNQTGTAMRYPFSSYRMVIIKKQK